MKKTTRNTIIAFIFVFCAVLFETLFASTFATSNLIGEIDTKDALKIHYLDVGQGDSIFIELPNKKTILIDAATGDYSQKIVDYIKKQNYTKIDYLFATHPHGDHIGGMKNVVNNFDLGKVYMPKVISNTFTYEKLLKAIADKGNTVKEAHAGMNIISEADLKLEILAPFDHEYESLNNYSIVLKLTYKDRKFLFMGDAENIVEDEITADVSADVIKIGHHGSSSSTSENFLKRVNPTIAIISVGKNNDYGHPHRETVAVLKETPTYRTDEHGTIVILSDGKKIDIEVEK